MKHSSQYSTTQLFSAEEYDKMSDPKKYESNDPRDLKLNISRKFRGTSKRRGIIHEKGCL